MFPCRFTVAGVGADFRIAYVAYVVELSDAASITTPKAFHQIAQRREAWRAHAGWGVDFIRYPNGVP